MCRSNLTYINTYIIFNGKYPSGYNIHHIDGNPENNKISNLVAIPIKLHKDYHYNEKQMYRCHKTKNTVGFYYHAGKMTELFNTIMNFKNIKF